MALTTFAKFKEWANPDMDTGRETEVDRIILAATAWIQSVTRWAIEQVTYQRYLDGRYAEGPNANILRLPFADRPVIHSGGDLVTVSENDVSLTVALGYSTSAGVYLVGANEEEQCALVKPSGSWIHGNQNVKVDYKAGYASDAIPADIEQLANEVTLLMLRSPAWIGRASKSTAAGSLNFDKDLTPQSSALIDRLVNRTL